MCNPIKVGRQRTRQAMEANMKGPGDAEPPELDTPKDRFMESFADDWPEIRDRAAQQIADGYNPSDPIFDGFHSVIRENLVDEIVGTSGEPGTVSLYEMAEAVRRGEDMTRWQCEYRHWRINVAKGIIENLYEELAEAEYRLVMALHEPDFD